MAGEGRTSLPPLPAGTVAILSTGGARPHAIPVSTCVAAAERRLVFALADGRESLRRLRRDPHAALTFLESGDVALTAHGTARVAEQPLAGLDGLAGLDFAVDSIQDHGQPSFAIDAGVRWRWTSDDAQARDDRVRDALADLAGRLES
jgi:hypothetical protein